MDLFDHRSHLFGVVPEPSQLQLILLDLFGIVHSTLVLIQDGLIAIHLLHLLLVHDRLATRLLNEVIQHLIGQFDEVLRLLCFIEVYLLEVLVLWFALLGSSRFVLAEPMLHVGRNVFIEAIWLSRFPRSREIGIIDGIFYCCVKVLKLLVLAPINMIYASPDGLPWIFLHVFACFRLWVIFNGSIGFF